MYSNNYIRNLLKKYIDQKINKFIIYPFGGNGVNVKNVLKDYFNLEPCFVVDNEYSKYNSKIIDEETLKKIYQRDMYIILSIEDKGTNAQMYKTLSEYILPDHIINLQRNNEKENYKKLYTGEGLLLRDFLPKLTLPIGEGAGRIKDKIKVRIVHRSAPCWNTIKTICQAFKEDSLFDLLLIVHDDWTWKQSVEQVQGIYRYVMWNEYQVQEDRPDIMVFSVPPAKPVDGLVSCREYAKLVVCAYWGIVRYEDSVDQFWDKLQLDMGIYCPDYYLFDTLQYSEIRESAYFSEKIVELGNAKFDGIYQAAQGKKYKKGWEKLEGKTTILWATSHGIYENRMPQKTLTFDLYAKTVFAYADENPEMGLVFRPSVGLITEMFRYGFWNQNDLIQLKKYCEETPNIVFDDTDTYENAYSVADGILTEAFSGMVYSALPLNKPICAAYRSKSDNPEYKELLDSLYSAYESNDIINFFEMVKSGQDPMLILREKTRKKLIKDFDGNNGRRIKEFVERKYFEKIDPG